MYISQIVSPYVVFDSVTIRGGWRRGAFFSMISPSPLKRKRVYKFEPYQLYVVKVNETKSI